MSLDNLTYLIDSLTTYADETLRFFGYCYVFNLVNWYLFGSILNVFGVIPRNLFGLLGVFFYPFLHGDSKHFISNALPLFILTLTGLSLVSFNDFVTVVIISHILTTAAIWFLARDGVHLGASGIVSALYGWILTITINEPSLGNIIILFTLFVYLGGILTGLMPQKEDVSWEGHLFGFLGGIITYFIQISQNFPIITLKVSNLILFFQTLAI